MKRTFLLFVCALFLGGVQAIEAACTTQTIALNVTVSGTLANDCESTHRSGSYAKYYVFTLTASTPVQINLSATAFDAYLFLLSGSGLNGSVVAQNDDGGGGTNSRVTQTLSSGTYTIEATSYRGGATGAFSIQVNASSSPNPPAPTPPPSCQSTIGLNVTVSGSLTNDCHSTHRTGRNAKFYVFTLTASTSVQVDVSTTAFDSYLLVLSGSGSSGVPIAEDDDSGGGSNSRISRTLSSGTYTVEVTSFDSGSTGAFSLTVAGSTSTTPPPTPPPPSSPPPSCQSTIGLNATVSGSLTADCPSAHRSGSYAKYYVFTLSARTAVQIDLSSTVFDAYVLLLSGSGSSGSVVAENDDGSSGNNSRIAQTLAAGTYTIEATSYRSGATGAFGVSIAAMGSNPPPTPPPTSSPVVLLSMTNVADPGYTSQNHQIAIFFDRSGNGALLIEIRATKDNWNDILEPGSMLINLPLQVEIDWQGVRSAYVRGEISAAELRALTDAGNASYFTAFPQRFTDLSCENVQEMIGHAVINEASMISSFVSGVVPAAGRLFSSAAPPVATWNTVTFLLDNMYQASDWFGDQDRIYPQFVKSERDNSGAFYGNSTRTVEFAWSPPDFSVLDRGYNAVAIKIPLRNSVASNSSIYFFGLVKVHAAFQRPWVTKFSKRVTGADLYR